MPPEPVPAPPTVNVNDWSAKVAVTEVAALTVTVQLPVPEHAPLQPVKVEPAAGVAVSVTEAPDPKLAAHVLPHAMPAGLLATVPVPPPALATVNVNDWSAKVAVTEVAALTVTVQAPVPEQPPPLQPVNVEPVAGAAVNATEVP